jgi:hypothetical protein
MMDGCEMCPDYFRSFIILPSPFYIGHLSGKSRVKRARFRNPKSEVRNPKQIKNMNAEIFKRSEGLFSFSAALICHQLFRIV